MITEHKRPSDHLEYVSRPEIPETFVDSLHTLFFDGNSVKLELLVHRFDEPKPPNPPSGQKITAARLVLSPSAAEQLLRALAGTAAVLKQQIVTGPTGPAASTKPH